jgi:starvation-inducible DNA-binding protein
MSLEFQHACSYPLAKLLASTYMLYLKTQNYHWNITGMHFYSLHKLFESQYESLAEANDEIAERIVALGDKAPGSFSSFLELSVLDEELDTVGASEMVRTLLADHETLAGLCHEVIEFMCEQQDPASADMATQRLAEHEKAAWMLRASLS